MATIFVNGCFDLLHQGHARFLQAAKLLGVGPSNAEHKYFTRNRLIVALNSDRYARELKHAKWGEPYPHESVVIRRKKIKPYCDDVYVFSTEQRLREIIKELMPCIICKGPDYAGKHVTGEDIAPVIILDTPEPESVKQMKIRVYGRLPGAANPADSCSADKL